MKYLLLLDSIDALQGVREDVGELISRIQADEETRGELLGIWIDPLLVADPPNVLHAGRVIVLETMGLSGLWLACRVESAEGSVSRRDLLEALAQLTLHRDPTGKRFIPVYQEGMDREAIAADLEKLFAIGGEILGEPWLQSRAGYLEPSCGVGY